MQNQNKGIVLLVEDNKKLLELNRRLLQSDTCDVHAAATLADARGILLSVKPDVAVLDISLPDGNGLDFAVELRAACKASVIFLTAHTASEDEEAGFEKGAVQYITKPYDVKRLRMIVYNLLSDIIASRTPAPASLLTAAELEVARLAIAGELNKNIASALNITKRCVTQRLTTIYQKLSITGNDFEKRALLREALGGNVFSG